MQNRYKVVIAGKNIYKEQLLPYQKTDRNIKIGTTNDADIRFKRDIFLEEFELYFSWQASGWTITGGENIYLTTDGVMKMYSKELDHGDTVTVKYRNFNTEVFKIEYSIDFETDNKLYTRVIDIPDDTSILIGGREGADIHILDPMAGEDTVTLSVKKGEYTLTDNHSQFGTYLNGQKIKSPVRLKDMDIFVFVGYGFYLRDNRLYTDSSMQVQNMSYKDVFDQQGACIYPKFQRSFRVEYDIVSEKIEVLPPKPLPVLDKKQLLINAFPVILTLLVAILLHGVISQGMIYNIIAGILIVVGLSLSVLGYIKDKRAHRELCKEREDSYKEYIEKKEKHIQKVWDKEKQILNRMYPTLDHNLASVREFNRHLFERDPKDKDYLHVRLGSGTIIPSSEIVYTKQEFKEAGDWLTGIPKDLASKYQFIMDAPVVVDFSSANALGFVGARDSLYDILKNVAMDIAIRQFYKDVRMFFIFEECHKERFAWLRWLKNVNNEDASYRNMVFDAESRNTALESLYFELSKREEMGENEVCSPTYIVFVYNKMGLETHPVSKYIEKASQYGFTFVFFEEEEDLVPKGCEQLVYLDGQNKMGKLRHTRKGSKVTHFRYVPVPDQTVESVAVKLAAVYVDEVNLESGLIKEVSLYQLLDIVTADDLDLKARWKSTEIEKTMAAPLGIRTKNEKLKLDIKAGKHGPNGLIAGTVGAGKTELLQSYVISMASLYHPHEVGFLLIDFNENGIIERLAPLPHILGSVTKGDGREINRALLSVRSEMQKRQELFSKFAVDDIDQYLKKYKAKEIAEPLPHLVILVDEFADLQPVQSDFLEELQKIAANSQNMGIHLLLATRWPSDAVTEHIRNRSNFRLCMQVRSKEDSDRILRTPLAAEIKESGRAYLQVGNNEVFELFQSANGNVSVENELTFKQKAFTINEVSLSGKRTPIFIRETKKRDGQEDTQLDALVRHIQQFCSTQSIGRLPKICLPPLPESIPVNPNPLRQKNHKNIVLPIGMYDDPENRDQHRMEVNLTQGNTFIIGGRKSGKSNMLQMLIRSVAQTYTPAEVNMYILDFGLGALQPFGELNHVGGVIAASSDEKLKHFMKMMDREIIARKEIISSHGFSSFDAYKDTDDNDMAQILIFINNFSGFKELYGEYDENILRLCREGNSIGMSVIIANLQSSGMGYKYLANFSNRIAMYCNDESEYSVLFNSTSVYPENIPGRCLVEKDNHVYLCQSYSAFEGKNEVNRLEDMKIFIENCNEKYPKIQAVKVPEVPKHLTYMDVINTYDLAKLAPYELPVGIGYDKVDLQTINLQQIGMFTLVGNENKAKLNFLYSIMEGLSRNTRKFPVKMHIIDGMDKNLEMFQDQSFVQSYSVDPLDFEDALRKVYEELEDRHSKLMHLGSDELDKLPLLVVLAHHPDILNTIRDNKEVVDICKKITKQYRGLKVCLMFSSVENTPIGLSAPSLFKLIKECKRSYYFGDLSTNKVLDIPAKALQKYKKFAKAGDAFDVASQKITKIKTIEVEQKLVRK